MNKANLTSKRANPAVLKTLVIDAADAIAAFAKERAAVWLRRSRWWTDFADSVESGESISDIQKQQGRDDGI
jgi:hypothetical protein